MGLAVIALLILGWRLTRPRCQSPFADFQKDPKMLASYSACLFWGVCAALLAVVLAYYFYW